jgi:parvulin-like peptidyl-prolyl isomerase
MRASHILVDTLEEAQLIRKKINQGIDISMLAFTHSTCPDSKNNLADLGEIALGQMDPAFEAALNSIGIGSHTGPIKTPAGYHIIKRTG